jgi:hypothetical protein
MPNKGNQRKRDSDDTTPTGTSGRRPGNEGAQEGSNEATPPPINENNRRRNTEDDEDSGLGNRTTFR